MKRWNLITLPLAVPLARLITVFSTFAVAAAEHDHRDRHSHDMLDQMRFTHLQVDELEWRNGDGTESAHWNAEAYYGDSLHRIGIETEGERNDGTTERANGELLYRYAVAPFWDMKLGWRHDFQPSPQRDWLAIGIDGLAPYGIDSEAMLYLGDSGRALLELKLGYELLLTQRLSLQPEFKLRLASEEDRDTHSGDGWNHAEAGLRLRYDITRKFAPYVGVVWERAYGDSADFMQANGEDVERTQIIAGLHFWL